MAFAAVFIYTALILKGRRQEIMRHTGTGLLILFVVTVLVAVYALTNTRDFIDIFHETLFAGKRWVFNAKESLMVNFFTRSLYKEAAKRVIVICAGAVFFIEGGLYFLLKH